MKWSGPLIAATRTHLAAQGQTSDSPIASAEDKKSVKTVRSHAILSIPFGCFRLRLGGDPLSGEVISSGANACRESPVAATRAHLASQRKNQWIPNISSREHEIVEKGKESCDYEHSPSMLPSASGRRSSRRSGPEVSARTHVRRVLSPPPVRIWPRKGRTSGSRITAAEDKKLMKTVRSHAIPSTPIRCFRMPLGDDLLGGSGLGSPRERQSREC